MVLKIYDLKITADFYNFSDWGGGDFTCSPPSMLLCSLYQSPYLFKQISIFSIRKTKKISGIIIFLKGVSKFPVLFLKTFVEYCEQWKIYYSPAPGFHSLSNFNYLHRRGYRKLLVTQKSRIRACINFTFTSFHPKDDDEIYLKITEARFRN